MTMHPQPLERSNKFRAPAPVPLGRPLGPIALLRTLKNNPIECWTQAHFEEPIVVGGFPFGRVAVVSAPAAIRKVLVENSINYRKSALQRRILSPRLRYGLVSVEGEQWHRQRRTLAPLFGRKMVKRFASAMASAAAALVERWCCLQDEGTTDIAAEMSRLALDALVRTVFSDGLNGDPEIMRVAMTAYFAAISSIDPFDVVGLPDFVPRITQWRARPLLRSVDQALNAIIAGRRLTLAEHSDGEPRDMLTVLLTAQDPETGQRMNDAEVKANILTFFVAGQETTATALTWAVYLLSQTPDWYARVAAESERKWSGPVDGLADRLVDTRAAIEEAMRLYPPIIGLSRTAVQQDELAGRTIEPGTMVVISPWVLHRHRLLWDDPDLFDPGRFLQGAQRIERHAYLPFGVGPRMCIGAAFALQETTIALATIMRHFTLRLAPGQSVWPRQTMTLRPRDGLHMMVRRTR
jgi:cytochrome P450